MLYTFLISNKQKNTKKQIDFYFEVALRGVFDCVTLKNIE